MKSLCLGWPTHTNSEENIYVCLELPLQKLISYLEPLIPIILMLPILKTSYFGTMLLLLLHMMLLSSSLCVLGLEALCSLVEGHPSNTNACHESSTIILLKISKRNLTLFQVRCCLIKKSAAPPTSSRLLPIKSKVHQRPRRNCDEKIGIVF